MEPTTLLRASATEIPLKRSPPGVTRELPLQTPRQSRRNRHNIIETQTALHFLYISKNSEPSELKPSFLGNHNTYAVFPWLLPDYRESHLISNNIFLPISTADILWETHFSNGNL